MDWLKTPGWLALAQALLHTLWQGAATAAVLWFVLRFVPGRCAQLRYALSVAALFLVLVMGIATWAVLDLPATSVSAIPSAGSPPRPVAAGPALVASRPAPTARPANAINAGGENRRTGLQYASVVWLLGASWMFMRNIRGIIGVARLRRNAHPVLNPEILRMVKRLCDRWNISRKVGLFSSGDVAFPSVMGFLEPAILLPVALISRCPVRDLQAVLAHELAHIRRWDYLVNLGQLLVEALLFFNPLVWWISRQIRIEREVCCDQIAAAECASAGDYVEALLSIVEAHRTGGPAPLALAMSGSGDAGRDRLLDRSRRLLVPGYMPAPRLRWFSLGVILIIASFGLTSFWLASRAVAQTIVNSDQARPVAADAQVFCKVTVGTEDGGLVEFDQAMVHAYEVYGPNGNGSMLAQSRVENLGSAPLWIFPRSQSVTVAAVKQGYAVVYAGPFEAPIKDRLDGLYLTLAKGFSAQVRVSDEAGKPIAGAHIHAYYPGPPQLPLADRVATDEAGLVTLDQIGEAPLNLRVLAEGYQADEIKGIALDSRKPYPWTLKSAKTLDGIVVSRLDGQPLAGAVIKLAGVRGPSDETYSNPAKAPQLAVADAQGRFRLASLRPDSRYFLFVDAPQHSGVLLGEIKSGQADLKVSLGPEIYVRGKFTNLSEADGRGGRYHFGYGQMFKIGDGFAETGTSVQLHPKDGVAEFLVGPLYEWPVNIRMGKKQVEVKVSELSKPDLVIDLAE